MDNIKKTVIEEYWVKKLSGDPPEVLLPLAADGKKGRTDAAVREGSHTASFKTGISTRVYDEFKRISKHSPIGMFILFLGTLIVVLHKYTGLEDLVVGTMSPAAGGDNGNPVFYRDKISRHLTVKEVITRAGQVLAEAFNYTGNSPGDILDERRGENGDGASKLYGVASIYEPFQKRSEFLNRFDLVLILQGQNGGQKERLALEVEYDTSVYPGEIVRRFSLNLVAALDRAIGNFDREAALLDILSEEERNRLLVEFNNTAAGYPGDKTLHRLFEEQVEKTPHKTAVVFNERQLTYRGLNAKANQLGRILRAKGVGPDVLVGIMLERSVEMILGLFGILKSGGAYLPVEPGYPVKRILYMMADGGVDLLLSRGPLTTSAETFESIREMSLEVMDLEAAHLYTGKEENPVNLNRPADLAYVIYTSGSTGNPKGVMIEHRSIVNRLNWMQRFYPIGEQDVILQKTPFVFDVSVWELFWWSIQGSSLCLLGVDEEKSPEAIMEAVGKNRVTTMHFVPSMLQIFLEFCEHGADSRLLSTLRRVFSSGEALGTHLAERFDQWLNRRNGTKLINLYGPTEAAVDVSYYDCLPGERVENIPIGKPIDNIQLYVVDKNLRLQPLGVEGELCISGVGLARGYLNRPRLTAEKFYRSHKSYKTYKSYILYKTGDLARWLPDGNIEYLGRIDHQVKIRGIRIELGEIENRLLRHEAIKEAVVLVKKTADNSNQHLSAYIVSEEKLNASQLREYLAGELPGYMLPSFFLQIENIPLTPNGKVDRKAVAALGKELEHGAPFVSPQNETQEKVAGIWSEVLKLDRVGIHDNYFELGGTSFDIIRINRRLREVFQVNIPVVKMFRYTTVYSFASYLNNDCSEETTIAGAPDRSAAVERGKMDRMQRLRKRYGVGNG